MPSYAALINRDTGGRCDVSPIFADPQAFADLVNDMAKAFIESKVTAVAAIDALGFILGSALALELKVPLFLIRKGGKMPTSVDRVTFVDYSGIEKALELAKGVVDSGARVLVVDEWIETGTQAQAAATLVQRQGGKVVGICAINIDDTAGTRELRDWYHCVSAVPADPSI